MSFGGAGTARRAARAPDQPRARDRDRRDRRGRRPHARHRRRGRGRTSSPRSSACTTTARASRWSPRSAGPSTSASDEVLVVVDPIDGSLNAKRGLPHHALSVAVATGTTMADVVFGFVYDLGPGEEWRATLGAGSVPQRRARSTDPPPERRTPTAASSCSRSSPPTRAGWRWPPTTWSPRRGGSARWARSPSRCARSPPRASTRMASLARCRAVDAAAAQLIVRESGGQVAFVGAADGPLGAPLDLVPAPSRRGGPLARDAAGAARAAGGLTLMHVDWALAGADRPYARPARRRPSTRRPPAWRETATAAREQIVAATGLVPDRARCRRPSGSTAAPGSTPTSRRCARRWGRSWRGDRGSAHGRGPLGALQNAGGAVVGAEVGALLGLFARRVLGQYELDLTRPESPRRGCCSSVPTSTAPRASSAPTATSWSPG